LLYLKNKLRGDIIKIGIDICSIKRFEKDNKNKELKFLNRFLNEEEIKLIKRTETIAGFWAVKEATAKALGCGIGKELSFYDIKIFKDNKNAPFIKFSKKIINNFNIKSSTVSISHDGGFAIAVVVIIMNN
jgi:holo-[acyl-carrier protein] synthase